MANLTRISPQEASQKLAEGWTYVDVRTVEEFEAGHPPGAVNVPIALWHHRNYVSLIGS